MKITGVLLLLCVLSGCATQQNTLPPVSGQLEPINTSIGGAYVK